MKRYIFFHFCAKRKRMCNTLVSFFNFRYPVLSLIFYHKIINFKSPVYQATSRFNNLLKTSRNIFMKYCGELWGIV
ncbi:hypothetical protein E5339_17495 [Phocaeicola sartorii]|uniref:Uncharacterized protein n=1 Tax=Phocaeicola sartorii TaxID=671267 RepID=A0A4S2FH71_9BACT|nr:hypothetical protein E5339_17495 [Phocaeicola sartorii]